MEIVEISRAYIKVSAMGRTIKIEGEGFSRQLAKDKSNPNYVDYVVYSDSLVKWDKPWEMEALSSEMKNDILAFLQEDFRRRGQILAVE